MVAYVVIPGIDGSDQEHWQTLWEQRWGSAAVRIAPQSWSHPDLRDWVGAVGRAVGSAAAPDREIVLVAHSLGCWAAVAWLDGEPDRSPLGAFLVAPPDSSAAAFPAEAASFLNIEPRPLRCRSMVVASTDDPYCDIGTATRLAASWGSDLHIVADLGHINTASRLGDWTRGQYLLDRSWVVPGNSRGARRRAQPAVNRSRCPGRSCPARSTSSSSTTAITG